MNDALTDRTPPHSPEAEEHLLSCCLLDGFKTISECLEANLPSGAFYVSANRVIYAKILEIYRIRPLVDIAVLAEELKTTKQLDAVGGYGYLTEISKKVPTTAQAQYFIDKLIELHALRELITVSNGTLEKCYTYDGDLPKILKDVREVAERIENPSTNNSFTVWSPSQFVGYTPDPSALLLGDGYVALGEWTSFIGIGGLGKTRLILWYCICQIAGRKWCDLPTHGQPQKSLILSTESGLRRLKTDLTKILAQLTPTEHELVETNLLLLALTPDEEGDMNLGDPANASRLTATLRKHKPGQIVLDPFSAIIDGDENKNADIVQTLRTLKRIQRSTVPNAAGILIHHARTGSANISQTGDNYNAGNLGRGGKALYSHVRCEIQLAPGDRDNPNLLVLACGKANDSEKFKTRGVIFDPESFTYSVDQTFDIDAWRRDVAGKRTEKTVTIADVVETVCELCPHAGDVVSTKDLCKHVIDVTGGGLRTVKKRIKDALADKYLRQPNRGKYTLGSKPLKK